ncbi:hypothetical protein BpHYR1_004856 [Brachionus plicatilis]|uniref:Secreted protein n=1 Tax=Brachionus plicatilis TaxID=10195 RepID=A0A3M7SYJ6_BRAPC|nr:hypothetical protein BpHYR1_004856 [Brachionus plicatilis]
MIFAFFCLCVLRKSFWLEDKQVGKLLLYIKHVQAEHIQTCHHLLDHLLLLIQSKFLKTKLETVVHGKFTLFYAKQELNKMYVNDTL